MTAPVHSDDIARAVALVEATPEFRVLRRVPDRLISQPGADVDAGVGVAVVLDVETTGVDTERCEVIELAMARIEYDRASGEVLGTSGRFSALRQPSCPIPPEVIRLTGIDDADVAGRSIDADEVERFIGPAGLVIAHNAAFDRPVAERHWQGFSSKAWGCSYREIDWAAAGYDGAKLGHLLLQSGAFRGAHRAADDVAALVHLLAMPLPSSGRTALSALLDRARRPTTRIWAEGAPYALKDDLKRRGYRWSDGAGGTPRAWWLDVGDGDVAAEFDYLNAGVIPGRPPPARRLTANDRYSARAASPLGPSSTRLPEQPDLTVRRAAEGSSP